MKICLKKVNGLCSNNEYNLIICADGCIGRDLRKNLPKSICSDGIKINIIVMTCDGILQAPALPCNNLIAISTPIKVIRRNTCCEVNNNTCSSLDNFNYSVNEIDDFEYNFNETENFDECNIISSECNNRSNFQSEEYAIIIRSFNPRLSEALCNFPQAYIEDCENTVKITFIFDKNGSVFMPTCINNCGFNGGCCGFGGGFGNSCGCGFFGIAALALLFCCF